VYKEFEQDFQDYHHLYQTPLGTDIFEHSKSQTLQARPGELHHRSLLAWSAMLKMGGREELHHVEPSKDSRHLQTGVSEGAHSGPKRYVKANNKHIAGYDPKIKSTYLLYPDANTLRLAMVQALP
jgi:hypothetical protein